MGIVNFVFRRGAIYTWRRRIPARVQCDAVHLQVSLGTSCPWTARRLAGIVTHESEEIFERMAFDGLGRDAARAWLERVIRDELERIERRKRAQADSREAGYGRRNAHEDRAMGHALRLLARDGISADLGPEERAELVTQGVPETEFSRVGDYLQLAAGEVLDEAVEAKIRRGAADAAGLEGLDVHQFLNARQIYLRGRAAAYLAASKRADPDFADALDLAECLAGKSLPPASPSVSSPEPDPIPVAEPAYDPAIPAIADRLAGRKELRKQATEKTAYQIRNTAGLLVEATGVADIRALKQSDLARFREVMAQLPPTYRKSAKEKDMPLEAIIAAAVARGAACGLAPATVNRNLGFVGQLLKQARSEGIEIDPLLDIRDLREQDDEDAQDKVKPFSREETRQIFNGSIWQGCKNKTRRNSPGDLVLRDGLYWIPLIAAYSGARREEIAGLACEDLVEEDRIWAFHFTGTEIRRVKNRPSRRKVPIHEHLIELGLLEHRDRVGRGQLFPELKRKSKLASLGDAIAYHWDRTLENQLGQQAEGRNFHSFRHYVTDELRYEQKLPEMIRHHILGHAIASVEDSRYGSRTPLSLMKPAIDALPRVF